MTNLATLRDTLDYSGRTDARAALISSEDFTLRSLSVLPQVVAYLDTRARSLTNATKDGRGLVNAGRNVFAWNSPNVARTVGDALWNRDVLSLAGTDCDLHFLSPGLVPASYTVIMAVSLDASNFAAGVTRFLWSTYDPVSNTFGPRFGVFKTGDGAVSGFTFTPNPSISGNSANSPASALPAPDTKHIVAVSFDANTRISTLYVDNPTIPKVTVTHPAGGAGPSGGTLQWWIGGVFGASGSGMVGKLPKWIAIDETAVKITDAVRFKIFSEMRAFLGTAAPGP